jgi:hypothetical protein
VRYGLNVHVVCRFSTVLSAVTWLWRLIPVLSLRRSGLDLRSVLMRFVVDEVSLREIFLSVQRGFRVNIIPSMLRTRLRLYVALTSRKNERSLGTFQKAKLVRKSGSIRQKSTVTFFFFFHISVSYLKRLVTCFLPRGPALWTKWL